MRTKNAINNITFSLINNIVSGLLRFILRTVFIRVLGVTILGLNGLFTNVLSILSLTELGISTAISFSLYKPLADKDSLKVAAYMNLYKKLYTWIAIIVSVIGMSLLPVMQYLIKDYNIVKQEVPYINYIYIFFLLNTVITYLMAYKRTLISADQKEYKIKPIILLFETALTITQIIVLYITKNYMLYLTSQIIIKIVENIFINRYINKRYPEIIQNKDEKLSKEDTSILKTNVKAMSVHKIGDVAIYSTDSLIISKFISIAMVGIYSNYVLIISVIKSFVGVIFTNLTSSLGNLIATEKDEKKEEIFNVINFLAFIMFSFSAVFLLILLNDFVSLWLGDSFVLPTNVTALLIIDLFLYGLRVPVSIVKASAGIYKQDAFVPVVGAIANLVVSIILGRIMGLFGVILGTIIGTSILSFWYRPIIIYRLVFHTSSKKYFKNIFKYILVFGVNVSLVYIVSNYTISFTNNIYSFIYSLVVAFLIQVIVIYLVFRKKEEFKKLVEISKTILKKKKEVK